MAELICTSPTAADATFSASGTTAWNAGMTANSGQLTPARGGTGADTSASSGIAHIAGGTWTVSAVVEADLTLADNTTANASTTAHGFLLKLNNSATQFMNGQGAWATPAGGASLDAITAAAANQAGILNADFNITWKWAPTTDSTNKFNITESVAATGGTVTSGVANQSLVTFATLAGSTASPFTVKTRGNLVMQASSTATQMLFATGTNSVPSISFTGAPGSGFYWVGAGSTFKATTGTSDAVQFDGTNGNQFFSLLKPSSNGAVSLGQGGVGWKGLYLDYTNTATVGAVTINKPSGRVIIGLGGTSVVVTNSLVTAASHVIAVNDNGDATGFVHSVVPAAGSFTINVAATTAQATYTFVVINAD